MKCKIYKPHNIRENKRLYLLSVILAILILTSVACFLISKFWLRSDYVATESPDNVISMWLFPIGEFSNPETVETFIGDFNKKYPDIKVDVEYLDYESGDDTISAAISAGIAPDIVMEGPERIVAKWGSKGYMADLSDMWTKQVKEDISFTEDSVEKACRGSSGIYYEYPLCKTVHCMAINYDVFKQAGALKYLDLENRTWSTEDFRQACQAVAASGLVKTPGIIYCGGQGGDQGTRALVSNLFGAEFTNKENTTYTIGSPEGVKALSFLRDMTKEGSLSFDTTIQASEAIELFAEEKTAMTFAWNSSIAKNYISKAKFNMFPMAFPTDENQPELCSGIWGFGVFDNGNPRKLENAKKLIDFLCNDEEQAIKSVQATGHSPVRSSLDDIYDGTQFEAVVEPFNELTKFVGEYYNVAPGWVLQRTVWWSMLQKVFSGANINVTMAEYSSMVNSSIDTIGQNNESGKKNGNSRVLFISSNSMDYPGIDKEIEGIRESLSDDAFLHCEFMDSTSIYSDVFIEKFYQYISDKYERIGNIGAIIVGGDNALKMVLRYRNGFFKDIPIIYESVNSASLAELAELYGIKGVHIPNTIIDNLDLACKLKPDMKKIYVISDNSYAGKALTAYVNGIKARYAKREIVIIDTSLYSGSEIKKNLSEIGEESMVLYITFTTDSTGKRYRYDQAIKEVTENTKAPVMSLKWLGNDTLGSISIDYISIGRQAGVLANEAIGISVPKDMEKVGLGNKKDSRTLSSFDVKTMKKFGISKRFLPNGTVYYRDRSTQEILWYIISGLVLAILLFMLRMFLYREDNKRRILMLEKLKAQNKKISEDAEIDALTGLGNRRLFNTDIQKSLNSGRSLSLFLFDLDRFKNINDTYGHLVGDAVLRETGNRLLAMKERNFSPYRYGGDEFAVLYFHSEKDDVPEKLEQLFSAFDAPVKLDDREIKVDVSIGSADFPDNATTTDELVQFADEALYYVKENGRNTIKRYSEIKGL